MQTARSRVLGPVAVASSGPLRPIDDVHRLTVPRFGKRPPLHRRRVDADPMQAFTAGKQMSQLVVKQQDGAVGEVLGDGLI